LKKRQESERETIT